MPEYIELLKYLIGAIPPLVFMVWKWWKDRQKDQIIDVKQFLKELQEMYDTVLKYKKEVMLLGVENDKLKSINLELNDTIKRLEKIISDLKGGNESDSKK